MGNDPQDTVLPLGNTSVAVTPGRGTRRFRADLAVLTLLPNRRRVRLRFEGPQGAVAVEIPRITFWKLTALFHERSIAADQPGPTPHRPKKGRRPL